MLSSLKRYLILAAVVVTFAIGALTVAPTKASAAYPAGQATGWHHHWHHHHHHIWHR